MILHVLDTLSRVPEVDRVVITTDSEQIAGVCRAHGWTDILERPPELASDEATVDDVVEWAAGQIPWAGMSDDVAQPSALLVVQPTVPEITVQQISEFIEGAKDSGLAVAMSVPARHLYWENPVSGRSTDIEQEVGVRYYPAGARGGSPHVALGSSSVTDVDTLGDLATVRQTLERKRILFAYVANNEVGSGHIRRCLALADSLQHHDVALYGDYRSESWGRDMVTERGYRSEPWDFGVEGGGADLVIVDTLDTEQPTRAPLSVHLEDHGPGARYADLVVNALYSPGVEAGRSVKHGADWAVLRSEFLGLPPKEIREDPVRVLVTFGGTDPSHLTERMLNLIFKYNMALDFTDWQVVAPPGRTLEEGWGSRLFHSTGWQDSDASVSMVGEMQAADLIITSAGRTVLEAAATGTPTIVLAQNQRETTHTHLGHSSGNIYLGLGKLVSDEEIARVVSTVLGDVQLRREMSERARASIDGKGLERIVFECERLLRGL